MRRSRASASRASPRPFENASATTLTSASMFALFHNSALHPVIEQLNRAAGLRLARPTGAQARAAGSDARPGDHAGAGGGSALRHLVVDPRRGACTSPGVEPGRVEGTNSRRVTRSDGRSRSPPSVTAGFRGRPMDRSDLAGTARSWCRSGAVRSGTSHHHLSARLLAAMGRGAARDAVHAQPDGSDDCAAIVRVVRGVSHCPTTFSGRSSARPTVFRCSSKS